MLRKLAWRAPRCTLLDHAAACRGAAHATAERRGQAFKVDLCQLVFCYEAVTTRRAAAACRCARRALQQPLVAAGRQLRGRFRSAPPPRSRACQRVHRAVKRRCRRRRGGRCSGFGSWGCVHRGLVLLAWCQVWLRMAVIERIGVAVS